MLEKIHTFINTDVIRRTFGYYLLFICLGLSLAITGPTLPALAGQTHSSLAGIGLLSWRVPLATPSVPLSAGGFSTA